MIIVYYDGKCGLCSREIRHYQKIAPAGIFNWQDITRKPEPFTKKGYTLAEGLKALHAEDEDGRMHIGVAAFILIWRQLPRWKWLARFASLPLIYHLAKLSYRVFAAWRFKRLDHCQLALQKERS